MEEEKQKIIDEREALIEMYKAGFLDGYTIKTKLKGDEDWTLLNKFYKLSFNKRFGKQITKHFKEKCKEVKKNGKRTK